MRVHKVRKVHDKGYYRQNEHNARNDGQQARAIVNQEAPRKDYYRQDYRYWEKQYLE